MKNYNTRIKFDHSSEKLFVAITQELNLWWGEQDNLINGHGDIFKVSWGEPWYQFKVIKYVSNDEMIWECIDANQKIRGLNDVEKEWVGSKVHWKLISKNIHQTVLEFEHVGLIPELLCFDVCSNGWNKYLQQSLVKYLKD